MPYDNGYRSHWGALGYGTDHGSAATGEPPPKQFIRLYHICSAEHAISNIEHARMKIACFEDLNDPFELRALEFRDRNMRTIVKNFGMGFGQSTGLLCFSEDWTSPVMWSHYGDGHRGICLGFDIPRRAVRRVIYKSTRLRIELPKEENPITLSTEMQRLLVRVKCREWAYERERRMFVPLEQAVAVDGLQFRSFDQCLQLREVILGPKCPYEISHVHAKASKHADVRLFKARLAWNHFKVVPVESSVP